MSCIFLSNIQKLAPQGNLVLFSFKKLLLSEICSPQQLRPLFHRVTWLGLRFCLLPEGSSFSVQVQLKISKIFFLLGTVMQLCQDIKINAKFNLLFLFCVNELP